jgi:hypothetical protein
MRYQRDAMDAARPDTSRAAVPCVVRGGYAAHSVLRAPFYVFLFIHNSFLAFIQLNEPDGRP